MGDQQSPPKVYADAESRQTAYHRATDHLLFTKDFNTALEAWRDDPLETAATRFLAWAKRTSWGRWSLYCVGEDGRPAYQVKAAEELHLDKRVISNTARYLVKRGYLGMDGKVLYPVISPVPADNSFRSDQKSLAYATFLEEWKVAHASDFQEFEDARSKVETYRKVLLRGFGQWKKQATNPAPSLLEEEEVLEEDPAPGQPVFSEPVPEPEPEKPAGRPVVVSEDNSLKAEIRKHLEGFKIPRLTAETVTEVSSHITSPQLLEAYVNATRPERFKDPPRSWGLLIRIAKEVGADALRYLQAAVGAPSPPGKPLSRAEQRKQEYLRKFEVEAST